MQQIGRMGGGGGLGGGPLPFKISIQGLQPTTSGFAFESDFCLMNLLLPLTALASVAAG